MTSRELRYGMDPIVRSPGRTRSEAILAQLCERAFLPLWCYPNLFRQQAAELADVLVVFGDDIVIFSDKDNAFPNTGNLNLDWTRWKSRSIDHSVRQLRRAEMWLRKYPTEVYLDAKCSIRFPFPINANARFHRVLVARNAKERCAQHLAGSGSLMVHGRTVPTPPTPVPFSIFLSEYKEFVHVFDDVTLPIVLRELDTAADFVEYLRKKEQALSDGTIRSSTGEEETLAVFLVSILHWARDTQERAFPATTPDRPLLIAEGNWSALSASEAYKTKKFADRNSYLWDDIMRDFGASLHRGDAPNPDNLPFSDLEQIGRYLASESRFSRRRLADAMLEARELVQEGCAFNRTIISREHPELAYVFNFFPRDEVDPDEEYRDSRREYIQLYAWHALRRLSDIREVLVVATDPNFLNRSSFDFLLVRREGLPEELLAIIDEAAVEYGWKRDLDDTDWTPSWNLDYPLLVEHKSLVYPVTPNERVERRKRRNARKAQRLARRRNRARA